MLSSKELLRCDEINPSECDQRSIAKPTLGQPETSSIDRASLNDVKKLASACVAFITRLTPTASAAGASSARAS